MSSASSSQALTRSGDGVQVVRAAAGHGQDVRARRRGRGVAAKRRSRCSAALCRPARPASYATRPASRRRRSPRLDAALDGGIELARGSVLIVDEAGMVGTRDLAALACAAHARTRSSSLVGDDRQLPEIQAGGAFGALAERLGAVELREVRRQQPGLGPVGARLRCGRGT